MIFQVAYHSPAKDLPNDSSDDPDTSKHYQTSHSAVVGHSERPPSLTCQSEGEFSFFNRSAITVPLRSGSLNQAHPDHKQILGGLMALNKQQASFQEEDAQLMQILANQTSTFLQVLEMYEGAGELFLGVIKSFITAIDAKDAYTQGHSQRVSDYSVLISQELGLEEAIVNDIRIGSLLHDIGKIGIPDSILLKNGKLSVEETETIKKHPYTGINILSQVKLLEPMKPAISEHHERLDGSGYPNHLKESQISLMGRIVAVADVFDAMTSDRPYRPALSVKDVLVHLKKYASTLFDLSCVQALETIIMRSKEASVDSNFN
jgi:putative nucleotidyltransferase with HDIG domain